MYRFIIDQLQLNSVPAMLARPAKSPTAMLTLETLSCRQTHWICSHLSLRPADHELLGCRPHLGQESARPTNSIISRDDGSGTAGAQAVVDWLVEQKLL
jgi:hypothetical protein